jgi:hypothetical protein
MKERGSTRGNKLVRLIADHLVQAEEAPTNALDAAHQDAADSAIKKLNDQGIIARIRKGQTPS